MPQANEKIRLKLTDKIIFPDRCVFCGCENPDGTVPLSPRDENIQNRERMILFAVPACTACAYSQSARHKQIGIVACALFLVLMTVVGSLVLKSYYSLILIALGILIIALIFSLDAFRVIKPLISIESVENSEIVFSSCDKEYSSLFKNLNENTEKNNGGNGNGS